MVGPSARYGASMAFDATSHEVVLWSGCSLTDCSNETWIWNGSIWVVRPTLHSPPPRIGAAMAYDRGRGVIVMYGGSNNSVGFFDDTWTFDGTDWHQENPATVPSARVEPAMAPDSTSDGLVMFGGEGDRLFDETWIWDGMNWTQQQPLLAPPPRRAQVMTFQEKQGNVMIFGGYDSRAQPLGDTWIWRPLLKLDSIDRLTNGHLVISGHAGPLRLIQIDGSSDPGHRFTTIGSVTSDATGAFQFEDADAAMFARRFYRASFP